MTDHEFNRLMRKKYSSIRINDLMAFLLVCEYGKANKAAEKMYMSPQGMGKLLKGLEATLGTTLFSRTGRSMQLTQAGVQCKKYAEQVINLTAQLQMDFHQIQNEDDEQVHFVCSRSILGTEVGNNIEDFAQRYPHIKVDVVFTSDVEVYRLVAENSCIGLSALSVEEPRAAHHTLKRYPYRFLVHESHPLAQAQTVSINDLQEIPLILFDEENMVHCNIVSLCNIAGFAPQVRYIANGAGSAARLVKSNKGCAVVTTHLADALNLEGIRCIPFGKEYTWDVVLLTPPVYAYMPEERLFCHYLRSKARKAD